MKVFGIDVIRGSVRSRTRRPFYALVRMEDGDVTAEEEVTRFRLSRLLATERPEILAVDSVQEIAEDQHALVSFMEGLPTSVRLVQVTGGERPESLPRVAARYNISFNRFDPYAEARATARIASLGGGHEVIAFENSCEVVVSRHRSIGKGGWSTNRYTRKIHGAVQQQAREVEAQLIGAGIRYDRKETRAFGGFSRVSFCVYAPRDLVPVHSFRGSDVQVRIMGRRLDRIMYRPATGRPRYLIVGIDPGTTTAIAAIDLDGNLVQTSSSRQTSMAEIIQQLYKLGKPLVIASDVHPMPFSVEKIRRAFSAIGYTPRQDRVVDEKLQLTTGFSYGNIHERDALSAALDALRQYRNKFQNITKRVPPGYDLDEVRARVIRGQSIEQVLTDLGAAPPQPKEKPPAIIEEPRDERVIVLDGMVKRLRGVVSDLQKDLQERDRQIGSLRKRLRRHQLQVDTRVKRDAEIAKRDAMIETGKARLREEEKHTRSLRKRLEKMKEVRRVEQIGDVYPFKVLPSLTRDGVKSLAADVGIRDGDVLYVPRSDGWGRTVVKELSELGVQALIAGNAASWNMDPQLLAAFEEFSLPLLPGGLIDVRIRGTAGTASEEQFQSAIRGWEERQRKREREQKTALIDNIFREYRVEREKEVRRSG